MQRRTRISMLTGALAMLIVPQGSGQVKPPARGFVRLSPELAARAEVRPSDLGRDWTRKFPRTFAPVTEVGIAGELWIKPVGRRPAVPVRSPVRRALLAPACYSEEHYVLRSSWPALACGGQISPGGCTPVTIYFVMEADCTSFNRCQSMPPNNVVCEYRLGSLRWTSSEEPMAEPRSQMWAACPGTGNPCVCRDQIGCPD